MQTFEDRLLEELKHVVAANRPAAESRRRPRRWTGLRIALTAGAVAAAVGTVVTVPALTEDKSARANAAERAPDGSIAVHLVEFTHPEQVEQKLRAFGVPAKVDFLPFGTQCKGREYDSDFWMSEEPVAGVFGDDPGSDPYADEDLRRIRVGRYRVLYAVFNGTVSYQNYRNASAGVTSWCAIAEHVPAGLLGCCVGS